MSMGRFSRPSGYHPEGIYQYLTVNDMWTWPLKRYIDCLTNVDALNKALDQAFRDLQRTNWAEKEQLRYGGLELLRDVDNWEGGDDE